MKKIEFIPKDELSQNCILPPKPSSMFLPEWFKKINKFIDTSNKRHRLPGGITNLTSKSCAPFFDSMISGYIIPLPCDIEAVDEKIYGHRMVWDVGYQVVSSHSNSQIFGLNIPEYYEKEPWKFELYWGIKTPPGYSCLFSPILNSFDSPFLPFSAVVDTDKYSYPVNIPFLLKKDFYGVIPKGTPIAQVIPFKRDKWKHEIKEYDRNNEFFLNILRSKFEKFYKNNYWERKVYK